MMKILSKTKLEQFWKTHPRVKAPAVRWLTITRNADWVDFSSIKQTFGTVDKASKFFVFNLAGNKFRLVTLVNFAHGYVFVRGLYTHGEYDQLDLKKLE